MPIVATKIPASAGPIMREELNETEYKKLQTAKWLVADPGKRALLSLSNKDGKRLNYTNKEHIKETKRLKYRRTINNKRKKMGITEQEDELKMYNSKSCNYVNYKEYVRKKNKVNEEVIKKYLKE